MGLHIGFSSASSCTTCLTDPNPRSFKILDIDTCGEYAIVWVKYPNCTNYEGKKILVVKDMTYEEISRLRYLDPHFTEDGKIVARFAPTSEGYRLACQLCR